MSKTIVILLISILACFIATFTMYSERDKLSIIYKAGLSHLLYQNIDGLFLNHPELCKRFYFSPKARDNSGTMQNNGVMVVATGRTFANTTDSNPLKDEDTYFGVIEEI